MTDPLIFCCQLDGNGNAKHVDQPEISAHLNDNKCLWAHLRVVPRETNKWLLDHKIDIDRLYADALLDDETRPRAMFEGESAFLIMRGVNFNDKYHPEDMVTIRVLARPNLILTFQRREVFAIKDIRASLETGQGPKTAGDFVQTLTQRLTDRMESFIFDIGDSLDDLEMNLLDGKTKDKGVELHELRRRTIIYRRHLVPQTAMLDDVLNSDINWYSKKNRHSIHESRHHIVRYLEELNVIKERGQLIQEELSMISAGSLNHNMYLLSIVAAIFLPLGFLTGLLGINIAGIPGAEYPFAFYVFCTFLIIIVTLQVILFKRMKLF